MKSGSLFKFVCSKSFVKAKLALFLQGVVDILCEACAALNWKNPSKIQREAIPLALKGNLNFITFKHSK